MGSKFAIHCTMQTPSHLFFVASDGRVELVVVVARLAVGTRQTVAVDARHSGHDDGSGAGGRGSHRDPDEAVVVVDHPTSVDDFVVVEFNVASAVASEVSAAADSDEDEGEDQDPCNQQSHHQCDQTM